MNLSSAQRATLRAHILANLDPVVVAAVAIRNDVAIQDWYKVDSSFVVWKTLLTKDELRAAALAGASEMDNLEAGKRDALFWMLSDSVNPSDSAVRVAFQDFTANRNGGFVATALRTSLTAAGKRPATRVEQVFATGTGTNGTPGFLVVEGFLDYNTISDILNAG